MFGTASVGGDLWILCRVLGFLYAAALLLGGAFSTSAFIFSKKNLCGALYIVMCEPVPLAVVITLKHYGF